MAGYGLILISENVSSRWGGESLMARQKIWCDSYQVKSKIDVTFMKLKIIMVKTLISTLYIEDDLSDSASSWDSPAVGIDSLMRIGKTQIFSSLLKFKARWYLSYDYLAKV